MTESIALNLKSSQKRHSISSLNRAVIDFFASVKSFRIWLYLANNEVKQKYRRSTLGPWWITLTMFIFVLAMGIIFARIFKSDLSEYIPFFTAGYLLWMLISGVLNESTYALRTHSGFIKQIKLPYNIYIFKHLTKHVILLLHNFVVYFIVIAYFRIPIKLEVFLVFPGLLLLLLNLYWISLFIALLSTRYRDLVAIVSNFVQIAFFVTPITWLPKLIGPHSKILLFNPFAYMLDLTRDPLLGIAPSPLTWLINIGFIVVGGGITLLLFARCYTRIPFWVD